MDDYWGAEALERQGQDLREAEATERDQSHHWWEAAPEIDPGQDWWREAEAGWREAEAGWGEAEAMEEDQGSLNPQPMDSKSSVMQHILNLNKKDPIGYTIFPASLCPPPLTVGAASRPSSSSSWALLDLKAYIADRQNETTAMDFTRAGHKIQATLCVVRRPRVSYLCMHCPALKPADFGTEPTILATCDGFILFKAAICNSYVCDEPVVQDFFIYQAPLSRIEGKPSLKRLPDPGAPFIIRNSAVGLILCSDDGEDASDSGGFTLRSHSTTHQHFLIAVLHRSQGSCGDTKYDLHRFDSREGKWSSEALQLGPMDPSPGLTFFYHDTHKVITLGGGFMGWVDLTQGILVCNVFVAHPELHFISLPQSLETDSRMTRASARCFRDIAVVHHQIKYVEHRTKFKPMSVTNGTYVYDDWTDTIWSKDFTPGCWQGSWHKEFECDASHMSGSLSQLLGYDETTPLPPLQTLHTGHPVLSLDGVGVVYILAKIDHKGDKACVLAINLQDRTLQAAERFGAERTMGIDVTYIQYKTSGLHIIGKKENPKKRPALLLGTMCKKRLGNVGSMI